MENLTEIIGNSAAIERLTGFIAADRIPHALLIAGPAGVGKRSAALAFAKVALCSHRQGYTCCNRCSSCTTFDVGTNPDFNLIDLIKEEKSIKVDQIRGLSDGAYSRPALSPYRAVLIKDAENMTLQAANALLKILEEPPSHLIILMTSSSADKLLPTIRSRLSEVHFSKLTEGELFTLLRSKNKRGDEAKLRAAAKMAGGNAARAIEIMRKRNPPEDIGGIIADAIIKGERYKALSTSGKISLNKGEFIAAIDGIIRHTARELREGADPKVCTALIHVAEKFRERASGAAALMPMSLAMLIEMWRKAYGYGLRS